MNPSVSILMPCLNERRYIRGCIDSLLANDYSNLFDITVIDGGSTDGTLDILAEYCARDHRVKILHNPKRTAPTALNLAIPLAEGEIIVRVDAHALYPKNYISRCVSALLVSGAANVGGLCRTVPATPSNFGWAVAKMQSHRFGVGNAEYRLANGCEPKWVDTVPFLCCRKSLFDNVGYFNEKLTRTQDIEFNRRIRNAGGGILLCPDIEITYFARSELVSMAHHAWRTGLWVILPFRLSKVVPISWRHIVPLLFVTSLLVTGIGGIFTKPVLMVFAAILATYLSFVFIASAEIAIQEKNLLYLVFSPLAFTAFHVSYGLGSLFGVWRLLSISSEASESKPG